jgi:hypothetical protein
MAINSGNGIRQFQSVTTSPLGNNQSALSFTTGATPTSTASTPAATTNGIVPNSPTVQLGNGALGQYGYKDGVPGIYIVSGGTASPTSTNASSTGNLPVTTPPTRTATSTPTTNGIVPNSPTVQLGNGALGQYGYKDGVPGIYVVSGGNTNPTSTPASPSVSFPATAPTAGTSTASGLTGVLPNTPTVQLGNGMVGQYGYQNGVPGLFVATMGTATSLAGAGLLGSATPNNPALSSASTGVSPIDPSTGGVQGASLLKPTISAVTPAQSMLMRNA